MRSLAAKLTLAFLLVGLTGSILVTVIIQSRARGRPSAISLSIRNNKPWWITWYCIIRRMAPGLEWATISSSLHVYPPGQPSGGFGTPNTGSPFTLVGADRTVVYSNQPDEVGQTLSKSTLSGAIALQSR